MHNAHFSEEEERHFKQSGQSIPLPDGEYCGVLSDVEFKIMKDASKKLILKYCITNPKNKAGNVYKQFLSLDNPKAYGLIKVIVSKFGVDTRELALRQIEGEMKSRQGSEVIFKLITDGKYQNPEIMQVIPRDEPNVAPSKILKDKDEF